MQLSKISQYSLVAILERWKGAFDNKKVFGTILTDLSKHLIASLMK